jgi:hypothetical protein
MGKLIQDRAVRQFDLAENVGITWMTWRKHQENALMIRFKRRVWRFGFKYTNRCGQEDSQKTDETA